MFKQSSESLTGGALEKKVVLKNSCSEIKKTNLPGDHSHKTIFSLTSTNIDITSSTQRCLIQVQFNIQFSILNIFASR